MAQTSSEYKTSQEDWLQHYPQLKKVGSEYKGPCPNPDCDSDDDGFWVKRDGTFGCRKCQPGKKNPTAHQAILQAVGLWQEPQLNGYAPVNGSRPPSGITPPPGTELKSSHLYKNINDDSVYVNRFEDSQGNKQIRQYPPGVEGPFLPLRSTAFPPGDKPIVLVEGEKCADYVNQHTSYFATTWIRGGGAWGKTDWNCLEGRKVILWPDDDDAGEKCMAELAEHLFSLDCDLWVADIPEYGDGIRDGWDAADCEPDLIQKFLDNAYQAQNPDGVQIVSGELPDQFKCWLPWQPIPGLLEVDAYSIWHGPPKSGKSALALLAAAQLLSGKTLVGIDNQATPNPGEHREHRLLMIWLEETKAIADMRKWAICKRYDLAPDIWKRSAWVYDLPTGDKRLPALQDAVDQVKPTVLMIDTLAQFNPAAEGSATDASKCSDGLKRIARRHNSAIMLIHHNRKMPGQDGGKTSGDETSRGSSALTGSARVMVEITSDNKSIVVEGGGTNNAASASIKMFKTEIEDINSQKVVVLVQSELPNLLEGFSRQQLSDAVDALCNAPDDQRRNDKRSPGWGGYVLADALDIDVGKLRKAKERTDDQRSAMKRVTTILDTWTRNQILAVKQIEIEYQKLKRKVVIYHRGSKSLRSSQ